WQPTCMHGSMTARRCRKPGASVCAASPIALSALRARLPARPTTRPRRGAPPACSITSQAPCSLPWEAQRIDEMRGDARRLLVSRLAIDHGVLPGDPFRLAENRTQDAIATLLLSDRPAGMVEVGELIAAA